MAKNKKFKKSQGNIIAVILIILLCLIAIIILWRIIFPIVDDTKQETEIRHDLSKTQVSVNDVSGNLEAPIADSIDITITRNSGQLDFINQTVRNYTVNTTEVIETTYTEMVNLSTNSSIVSVIDISDSMSNKQCSVTGPACTEQFYCLYACLGIWKTKLYFAKEANVNFINTIFGINEYNKMAVVGFARYVQPEYCEPYNCYSLTGDTIMLTNKVNWFSTHSNTNVCQGLDRAIRILGSSNHKIKIIVLMSDGDPICRCDGSVCKDGPIYRDIAKNESVEQAYIAEENNITIFTIGFGENVDVGFLSSLANITGGTYAYADPSILSEIYNNITKIIIYWRI